jgi:5-methylcytosine-specific restriction endonuclease McrA
MRTNDEIGQAGVLAAEHVGCLPELEHAGLVLVDWATGEAYVPGLIQDEAVTRDGDAVERIVQQTMTVRSVTLRTLLTDELRKIGTLRARIVADCLDQGRQIPERGRISLLTREELTAARLAFVSCPDRLRLREEIHAGLHVCAHCGGDGTPEPGRHMHFLQVDHRVSLALGGPNATANYQVLCGDCNARKGAVA